ncbi:hypothetical protein RUESEDTHA_04135 [Ruegeria sp. THAF57]|uniref:GFA family protein n=1 Tax=Ruegeria sp. THAF57 TaxID=2744555 RepID=UPI0015DEAEA6|nr:GFA family protein [Ruegeria sp. THAF57]CAD0187223.1 hypothetical protein RUESEDTHA_04135 [Ruegeria sp. THAF57]
MTTLTGHCTCGEVRFDLHEKPLFRAICHCSICQQFNDAPYGDIVVVPSRAVDLNSEDGVSYQSLKAPPILQRGRCATCGAPSIERLNMPLFPRLTLVPVSRITDPAALPDPSFHIFYECRQSDAADDLPKRSGYLRSQMTFASVLIKALFRRR